MLQKKMNRVIIGQFHAAWSIGAASSAAVSGVLASFISLKVHLFVIPILALIAFEIFARLMLTPKEDGHHEEKTSSSGTSFLKSPPQLWLLTVGLFAGVFPELMMMDWSAVFSKQILMLGVTLGAVPYTVFTVAMIVSRLLIGKMTKHFHISEISMWGGIFGSIAMLLGVLLAPPLVAENHILGLVVISIFWGISGLGLGPMVPSFFSAAGHVKGLSTAQALSRMSLVNSLVIMGAKIAMGGLAEGVGLEIAFLFPIVMMFIAGILAGQVAKRAKAKEAVENAFPPTGPLSVVDEL
ncbi:MAG: MFS transporter, partial [Actinomycetota bacterium]